MTVWLGAILLLVGVVVALGGAAVLPLEATESYLREGRPIELATACLWFVLALAIAIYGLVCDRALLTLAFLAVLAGAREMDAHAMFTSEPVTNLRYWLRDGPPPSERIIVASTLIAIAAVIVIGLMRHWRRLVRSLLAGESAAASVATVILAVPTLLSYWSMERRDSIRILPERRLNRRSASFQSQLRKLAS